MALSVMMYRNRVIGQWYDGILMHIEIEVYIGSVMAWYFMKLD